MRKKLLAFTVAAALAAPALSSPKTTSTGPAAETASAPPAASAPAAAAVPATAPEIAATAYAVEDLQSGQILLSSGLDKQIEPASLTKLMTAYLVFKALEEKKIDPKQPFTVSERAWKSEGSRMFLEMGKTAEVKDLIRGLIVQSGNDSAVALAEGIAGSEEAFVAMMNDEARRLGMTQTVFENSTGLPGPKHLTTVRDLLILSAAIIRDYPAYYPIYAEKSFTYNGITQPNRNLLLYRDASVDGLKTGHTSSAGYNLVASAKRGEQGRRILSVVVGTASQEARATESSKLLNYAFQAFDTQKMFAAGQVVDKVKVYKGASGSVPIGFTDDAYITIPHGKSTSVKTLLETEEPVLAPIQKGQVLGTLKLMDGDQVIGEKKVLALESVSEAGLFGRMWDGLILWFKSLFAD